MNLNPLADRVIVKRLAAKTETAGGLVIPEACQDKSLECEVLAVGPGVYLSDGKIRTLDVAVGDRVVVTKYVGTELKVAGQDVLVVREEEIIGILV